MKQKIYIAALLAGMLALAGCGGGSSGISETAAKERAEKAVEDALAGITPCEGDGVMVDDDGKCVRDQDHMSDADKAEAMKDLGEAMYPALAGPDPDAQDALDNNGVAPSLTSDGLMIDVDNEAGALGEGVNPVAETLTAVAGATVDSLSGWKGMDYAHSTGTGDDKYDDHEARVYHNQGAPKTQPFAGGTNPKYVLAVNIEGANANQNGYLAGLVNSGSNTALDVSLDANRGMIRADRFNVQGQQDLGASPNPQTETPLKVRGTFDGASGEFRCQSSNSERCSVTNNGSGAPSALGGTWWFRPDAGARVSMPDANYLYFGWWVHKDSDGDPLAASAFAGRVGTDPGNSTDGLDPAVDLTGATLNGSSATYKGAAVGKFALNNAQAGTGNGGHFTADASLTAKFGQDTNDTNSNNSGVTGTINNFRLNDGTEDPGWSVSLKERELGATLSVVGTQANTVWSINGNDANDTAAARGNWTGSLWDEKPGNAPDGDGSNIPTTVTGTFYSEFNNAGRMVGAFGANKQ